MASKTLDTVLLLALPASGKSEVRKYLANLTPQQCENDFHMGHTVQLDDYPYVHFMRCTDDALNKIGKERVFFTSGDKPFRDPRHWGTLIELLNEDYEDLHSKKTVNPKSSSMHLFDRIDAAAKKVGATNLSGLDAVSKNALADILEHEAVKIVKDKNENSQADLAGKTIVIECARGGAHGSAFPLKEPFGYKYSLSRLSDHILKRSSILYVWVTPEESRRKNQERTDPNDPGSILNHGVPIDVMMNDYGCDDMDWLEKNSGKPETIRIEARGKSYQIPIARFDNRVDKTSFIRNDKSKWSAEQIKAVHEGLKGALTKLANFSRNIS